MSVEKCGWAIQKSLFANNNQNSAFSYTRKNSKMFNITSKYFSFVDNKPPASWFVHIARDFLKSYSCLYYSSMFNGNMRICTYLDQIQAVMKYKHLLISWFACAIYHVSINISLCVSTGACNSTTILKKPDHYYLFITFAKVSSY